jgi:hypothetical protein
MGAKSRGYERERQRKKEKKNTAMWEFCGVADLG